MSETTKGQADFELKAEKNTEDERLEIIKPEFDQNVQMEEKTFDFERQPLDDRSDETVEAGGVPGMPVVAEKFDVTDELVQAGGVPGKDLELKETVEAGGVPGMAAETVQAGGVPGKDLGAGGVPGTPVIDERIESAAGTIQAGGVPGKPAEDERLEAAAESVQAGGVPGKEIDDQGVDEAGGMPGAPVLASAYDTQDIEVAAIDGQPIEHVNDDGGAVEAGGVPGHEIGKQADLDLAGELRQPGDVLDLGPQQLDELTKLEQVAAGGVPGVGLDAVQDLDVFDAPGEGMTDFNPFAAGGVPGHDLGAADPSDLLGSQGADKGDPGDAGDGFNLPGISGLGGDKGADLGSYGLGASGQQGYQGSQGSDDNIGTPPSFGSGSSGGSSGSSGSSAAPVGGNPGSHFGNDGGGTDAPAGDTFTSISESYDYQSSDGSTTIVNTITTYDHQTGTTMVDHTTHNDKEGTTQNITVYDKDGNVVDQETTHDPPAGSGGEGGSSGSEGSGSESGTSGEATPSNEGGEDGYTPADDYGQMGGAIDFKLGQPAVDGLTVPVDEGAGDLRWGAERLIPFGDGINDPRTVYPTGEDTGAGGGGGGNAGGGLPGEGVVDPVGPGFITEGFASDLSSNADDEVMEPTSFDIRDEVEF